MELLAWALFLFFGWGSAGGPDFAVSAPSGGARQLQTMHDGTPIPPATVHAMHDGTPIPPS